MFQVYMTMYKMCFQGNSDQQGKYFQSHHRLALMFLHLQYNRTQVRRLHLAELDPGHYTLYHLHIEDKH